MTDREKLYELLNKGIETLGNNYKGRFLYAYADYLLANGVTVQEWTPASNPPEVWRDKKGTLINYLVYMPEYGVDVGNYMEPAKTWICMGIPCKVTHWMPMPEPPKEAIDN